MGFNLNFKMPNISLPSLESFDLNNLNVDKLKSLDIKSKIPSLDASSLGVGSLESALNGAASDLPSQIESMNSQIQNGEEPDLSALNIDINI